jgi:hypothetical protein
MKQSTDQFRQPLPDRNYDSWKHRVAAPQAVEHPNVQKAIELLQEIEDFDGETMEYIISEMFMRAQMLKQLVGTCDWGDVFMCFEERRLSSEY